MSRIAERGVRLSQFHTTALCSPTRASLLTGRNATTVGMATIEEFTDGFPNCNGRIPADTALLSEVLNERGYNTYCVGKWHLTPLEESNLAATKRHWPLSRGFERFYGFMGGETDQWYPDLVYDNHQVAPPATPEEGYHLSKDLADKTIEFIRDAKVIAPDKPWFSYVCPGAGHAPHHVFKEWADKYAGKFDMGYERYREIVLENQKKLGIVPSGHRIVADQPVSRRQGPQRGAVAAAGHGAAVGVAERRREAPVQPDGRGVRRIPVLHRRPDRPHPGLPRGVRAAGQHHHRRDLRQRRQRRGRPERVGQRGEVLQRLHRHRRGEHEATSTISAARRPTPHYPIGWAMAFNTPYKLYKRYASHEGGIADTAIICWPNGIKAHGEVRDNYVNVCDITPTIYDLLGITPPDEVGGIAQKPLDGVSFKAALDDPTADTGKDTQFYTMLGTRGIWHNGWFANTVHAATPAGWSHFDKDRWELYHIEADRSQCHDLAAEQPGQARGNEDAVVHRGRRSTTGCRSPTSTSWRR